MEKGFNDDELADIMNEIESLEKEFSHDDVENKTETVETHSASTEHGPEVEAEVGEPQASEPTQQAASEEEEIHDVGEQPVAQVEEEMNEVLGELSKMPVEDIVPEKRESDSVHSESAHSEHEDNIHHLKEASSVASSHESANHGIQKGSHTAMSFHVEGEMKFELSFHIAGKFVGLTVTEEGLEIGLDGGAKFTIPVEENAHSHKKAS